LGEVFGALGQILIAIVAVYVAWRQLGESKSARLFMLLALEKLCAANF